jgi:TonB family protein
MRFHPFACAITLLTVCILFLPCDAAVTDSAVTADSLPPIDSMPSLVHFVKAEYPDSLVKKGIEGLVALDVVVNAVGTVDSVAVVRGLNPILDSAAVAACKAFVFKPAIAGGKPIPVLMEYDYRFSINEVLSHIDEFVNISGHIYEQGTRAPLVNATVTATVMDTAADTALHVPFTAYLKKIGGFAGQYLESGSLVTTTDSTGYFQFKSLPAGSTALHVIMPDYENFFDNITVKQAMAVDVVYRLLRVGYGSDNVIVVYGKAKKKEVAQRTLTLNEVKKIPGLGGDAVKVIQALPGVARTSFLSGAIIVRGSGNGDTRFFLDGVTLPALFHFGGLTSTYNSEALTSVDLYPGGFGTRYGGALGGVVEIKGRQPKTDRVHGYLDVNLFDASFLVEGPLSDKLSFLVTARRSYVADVMNFFLEKVAHKSLPFTVVPYYWDYIARMDYNPLKNHHMYLTLFGAQDKLDLLSSGSNGGSVQISDQVNKLSSSELFNMGIFGWDWDINNQFKNELHYALCNIDNGTSAFGIFDVHGTSLAHYFRDQVSYKTSDNLTLNFGADMQYIPYDLILTAPDQNNRIIRDTSHYKLGPIGAYVNAEWKASEKLTLLPGVRYDYYPELDYNGSLIPEFWDYNLNNNRGTSGEPSFRLTARYKISDRHTLKGSAGTYNETPQPMGQAIDKQWGNPELSAEKGSQYVLGYEWKISDLISSDIQAYYNRQWDLARAPSQTELAANASLPDYLGDGKGRMSGIELLLKHDQGKRFFGWISYSLSKSERFNVNDSTWTLFRYDQTHNLQLIGSLRFTGGQEAGVRLRFVTGNPTTPVVGVKYYDATNRTYVPQYGPENSDRMKPYISLDVRYEKKIVYRKWQWSYYIDITHLENMFGAGYKSPELSNYMWSYDYTQKYSVSDITRPAVGVKLEF